MDFYFHPVHVWLYLVDFARGLCTKEMLFLAAACGWFLTLPGWPDEETILPFPVQLSLHAIFFAALVSYPATLPQLRELEIGERRARDVEEEPTRLAA